MPSTGEALEASDLSPHPGHALAGRGARPIRSRARYRAAHRIRACSRTRRSRRLAKLLATGCRLFALTVTEEGVVELVHVRDGGAVPVSRFRIDFQKPISKPNTAAAGPYVPWSGDVETIPYPFRFGLTNRVADLAFDNRGEVLLAATVGGFLHAWRLQDGSVEVLPRGCKDGHVMKPCRRSSVSGMASPCAVASGMDWGSCITISRRERRRCTR